MRNSLSWLIALSGLVQARPTTLSADERRQVSDIPQYVLDYAPLCWLDASEKYFPADIAAHLTHTHPTLKANPVTDAASPLTLSNLDSLNAYDTNGIDTYLTSNEGINSNPQPGWFFGVKPDDSGSTSSATGSTIIVVPKANGIVDAFYFYFYSFDQGNWVLEQPLLEFGDHVGDWEHTMIRFVNSVPTTMYFSQHSGGEAFDFNIIERDSSSGRPINYVARGTHANYAIGGDHDHTIPNLNLPFGALLDHTSKGTLWDPTLNTLIFTYNTASDTFSSPSGTPVAWLKWNGHWGDPQLSDGAAGQFNLFGARKYVAGPTGPHDKKLGREKVCQSTDQPCIVRRVIVP